MQKTQRRLPAKERITFISGWVRNPRKVGALAPSGKALAKAMAGMVDVQEPGVIVELGGGTGPITSALLKAGVNPKNLVVVERDPHFFKMLTKKFPDVQVVNGDARDLKELLNERGITEINAVVSSLPLLMIKDEDVAEILRQSFSVIRPGGHFAQFTYSLKSPVPASVLQDSGCLVRQAGFVLRNVPPATMWVFTARYQPYFRDNAAESAIALHA